MFTLKHEYNVYETCSFFNAAVRCRESTAVLLKGQTWSNVSYAIMRLMRLMNMSALHNENFRIRVLAITQLQATDIKIRGWMTGRIFLYDPTFITWFSITRGLTTTQLPRYSKSNLTMDSVYGKKPPNGITNRLLYYTHTRTQFLFVFVGYILVSLRTKRNGMITLSLCEVVMK